MAVFEGRVALVTGASSGIGAAVAGALGRAGAHVHLVGRDPARLGAAAAAIEAAAVYAIDLTDEGAIAAVRERIAHTSGRLDILVHAAGAFAWGVIAGTPAEELDRLRAINVLVPGELSRALLPLLVETGGEIVFMNSSAVHRPRAALETYASGKLALRDLTDALRDEVNPLGVRVLSIFPGRTATPMQERITEYEGGVYRPERLLQPEDVAQAVIGAITLPRTAEVTEIHIRPMQGPSSGSSSRD